MTRPRRVITLHRSHIFFTEGRTFTSISTARTVQGRLPIPVDDPASRQVVGRQLHQDAIPGKDPDVVHPHLPRDVGQDPVPVVQLDPEHGVGKRLEIGLTYIYGIGQPTARKVASALGLNADTKIRDLTEDEVTKLRNYIDENLEVEGDLRRDRSQAIKRLGEIGAYRGIRHRRGLPVNGQRTRTNGRTRKGPKKTVGVRRKSK